MRLGFVLDLNRCTGCRACCLACSIENRLDPEMSWRQVSTFNGQRHPEQPLYHLSLACNHCADAPCLKQCPARALSRSETTGAVLLDSDRCIGCRYCSWTCPYDAPRFDEAAGVMTKCTFCSARLDENRDPACVATCPTGALTYGAVDQAGGVAAVPGFPESSFEPSLRFKPLRGERNPPEIAPNPVSRTLDELFLADCVLPDPAITLRSEWPLTLFTLCAALLPAWFAAYLVESAPLDPAAFLGAGLAAVALSSIHLGRKSRAARAALNLGSSWLSREIVFFALFLGLAAVLLLPAAPGFAARWLLLPAGLATLVAIDRIYDPVRIAAPRWLHSADTLPTGLFAAGVLLGAQPLFISLGLLKLILYVWRKLASTSGTTRIPPVFSAARLGIGFALPLILWLADPQGLGPAAALSVCLGELIDRCEFYREIDRETPARSMILELRRRVER